LARGVAAARPRAVVLAAAALGGRPGDLRAVTTLAARAVVFAARVAFGAALVPRVLTGLRPGAAFVARAPVAFAARAGAAFAVRVVLAARAGAFTLGFFTAAAFVPRVAFAGAFLAAGFGLAVRPVVFAGALFRVVAFTAMARPRNGVGVVSSLLILP
jgi:hypothetical protein